MKERKIHWRKRSLFIIDGIEETMCGLALKREYSTYSKNKVTCKHCKRIIEAEKASFISLFCDMGQYAKQI